MARRNWRLLAIRSAASMMLATVFAVCPAFAQEEKSDPAKDQAKQGGSSPEAAKPIDRLERKLDRVIKELETLREDLRRDGPQQRPRGPHGHAGPQFPHRPGFAPPGHHPGPHHAGPGGWHGWYHGHGPHFGWGGGWYGPPRTLRHDFRRFDGPPPGERREKARPPRDDEGKPRPPKSPSDRPKDKKEKKDDAQPQPPAPAEEQDEGASI